MRLTSLFPGDTFAPYYSPAFLQPARTNNSVLSGAIMNISRRKSPKYGSLAPASFWMYTSSLDGAMEGVVLLVTVITPKRRECDVVGEGEIKRLPCHAPFTLQTSGRNLFFEVLELTSAEYQK